jgi:hypothetical protein
MGPIDYNWHLTIGVARLECAILEMPKGRCQWREAITSGSTLFTFALWTLMGGAMCVWRSRPTSVFRPKRLQLQLDNLNAAKPS